jgi:5-methylcytosine-specific restriction endonuclease McrA
MLREVKNAWFDRRTLMLGDTPVASWRRRAFRAMHAAQDERPAALVERDGRVYWAFERRIYWEDAGLTGKDVLALVRERERRERRTLRRARAALAGEQAQPRRQPIPREVRLAVFERDGGRCVECGAGFDLQYDHVIPVAHGGASTVENLQVLCAPCNQAKGDRL